MSQLGVDAATKRRCHEYLTRTRPRLNGALFEIKPITAEFLKKENPKSRRQPSLALNGNLEHQIRFVNTATRWDFLLCWPQNLRNVKRPSTKFKRILGCDRIRFVARHPLPRPCQFLNEYFLDFQRNMNLTVSQARKIFNQMVFIYARDPATQQQAHENAQQEDEDDDDDEGEVPSGSSDSSSEDADNLSDSDVAGHLSEEPESEAEAPAEMMGVVKMEEVQQQQQQQDAGDYYLSYLENDLFQLPTSSEERYEEFSGDIFWSSPSTLDDLYL